MANEINLAELLAIWPITESFASHVPVGDLITLGRTSSSLRSSLHGLIPESDGPGGLSILRQSDCLHPEVGRHQTSDWAYLKSIAPFTCSSTTHTRGQRLRPCVYCSKPICDACIVRDSFKHRNENTFKNRLRYFCKDCWSEGRPTRSFRYPVINVSDDGIVLDSSSRPQIDDKPHVELNEFCNCNLKDNGWLCLDCKEEQNSSPLAYSRLLLNHTPEHKEICCYGLCCENAIDTGSPEKDRRRVCLWCQKPLRRQWGGEDRFVWNMKTVEARARNAESRSRDLEEYNRKRLKVMRMSRAEMRGTSGPGDDQPIFLRHLDVVNYRNWMGQDKVPNPDAVWKSKNGYWRYQPGFLYAVQKKCNLVSFDRIGDVSIGEIARSTSEGCLAFARLNKEMYPDYTGSGVPKIREHGYATRHRSSRMHELKAHIMDMYVVQCQTRDEMLRLLEEQYAVNTNAQSFELQLSRWLEQVQYPVRGMADERSNIGETSTAPENSQHEDQSGSSDNCQAQEAGVSAALLQSENEEHEPSNTTEHNLAVEAQAPPTAERTEHQGGDDPPPYLP